ncbi:UPF0223 family protein [Lentilactobacillus kosonis]|uniref:Uncharacterized protein n=1 Tax=Lentilactobacillus kosonis TaxID=2810561 RepID=A0A401FPB0_9LACO|nr:UPF0223 family protein [Lentilactobacillus kosonis]GAY74108.1 hypothetical protein NBRC111893_2254 [Lentilactobacillus kosonis]
MRIRGGIERSEFQSAYNKFRAIIPAKSEQKQLEKRFADESGFDSYQAIKQLEQTESSLIKVGDRNG